MAMLRLAIDLCYVSIVIAVLAAFMHVKYFPASKVPANTVTITIKSPINEFRSDSFSDLKNNHPGILNYQGITKASKSSLDRYADPKENWQIYINKIHKSRLYDAHRDSNLMEKIVADLSSQEIVDATEFLSAGTQLKLLLTLRNGAQVLMKPKRMERYMAYVMRELKSFPAYEDVERHNAEIAAFHLDKVLGFHRVPPAVGRLINVTRELESTTSDENFKKTISHDFDGRVCFHGNCNMHCRSADRVCGEPELIEASVQLFIPSEPNKDIVSLAHPWKAQRSSKRKRVIGDSKHCDKFQFGKSRTLLDLIDLSIFDYLTGNRDRHDFDKYATFAGEAFIIGFDNGKGFGDVFTDYSDILTGLVHCCKIRYSTLNRLLTFHSGPVSLGEAFWESTRSDPLFPIVVEEYFEAINRRVGNILNQVRQCILEKGNSESVVYDDGF